LRLLILARNFRRAKIGEKIGLILLALFLLGILVAVFLVSFRLLDFLRSLEITEITSYLHPLIETAPVLVFSGAFLGILVTSFGILLQALYLAGDMDFLLSNPIPIRAVFIAKLLQAVLPNLALISLFALPLLYGLAFSEHYNFLYYPLVLLTLIALALAAAGISSLLVIVIVRVLPARRVVEVLGFLGAILTLLCSQSGQLASWEKVSPQQAEQALGLISRLDTPWSPLAWAGRGVASIGQGDWSTGIGLTLLTLGMASVVFMAALITAEKFYYTGWARMQGQGQRKRATRPDRARPGGISSPTRAASWIRRLIPANVGAVLKKDFLVMRRDLRNMSQLISPLIFGIIYAILMLRGGGKVPDGRGEAPAWLLDTMRSLSIYSSVGLSLFVSWMLLGRLAGIGFSQEGKNYWLIKTAPVSESRLILSKYLAAYLPTLGLSWIFVIGTWLLKNTGVAVFLYSLPVVALCIAGNAGILLAFGITGANLAWEDPRQMQKGGSGCLGSMITMIYLPVALVLFFGPPIGATAFGLPEFAGQLTGLVLGGVFSLTCAITPLWLVRKKVPRLGEA
jgi:ABC-2 type transport system permease protein